MQRLCKADSDGGGCPGACAGVFCPHVAVIPGGVWRHLVEFFERSAGLLSDGVCGGESGRFALRSWQRVVTLWVL